MTDDIVERLRGASSSPGRDALGIGEHWNLEDEAADTIEALRRELAAAKESAEFAWKNTRVIDKSRIETEEKLAALTAERDAIRAAFKTASTDEENKLREQLAASQAYSQQLLDALGKAQIGIPLGEQHDPTWWILQDALAIPTDNTALNAWGAKLLRDFKDNVREILRDSALLSYEGCSAIQAELDRMADELEGKK